MRDKKPRFLDSIRTGIDAINDPTPEHFKKALADPALFPPSGVAQKLRPKMAKKVGRPRKKAKVTPTKEQKETTDKAKEDFKARFRKTKQDYLGVQKRGR